MSWCDSRLILGDSIAQPAVTQQKDVDRIQRTPSIRRIEPNEIAAGR